MTIVSTGLFAIQETTLETRAPVTIFDAFNGSSFNTTSTDMGPWAISYGIQYKNLSYPFGTTETHVFPRFNVSTNAGDLFSRGDTLKVDVDILTFDLPCERADVGFQTWYRPPDSSRPTNMTLSTPSCQNTSEVSYLASPLFGDSGLGSGLRLRTATCNSNDALHVTAVVRTNGTIGQPILTDNNETMHLQFVGLLCTPIYNMSRGSVSHSGDPGSANSVTNIDIPPGAQTTILPGVSSSDLLRAIWDQGLTTMIDASLRNQSEDTDWLNDTVALEHVVRTSHNIIGIQIAKDKLLQPLNTSTDGIVNHIEQRLVDRRLSLALLVAISVVLASILLGILLSKPLRACPRDPGPIGGLATILVDSQEVLKSLEELGAAGNSQLTDNLHGFSYCTTFERSPQGTPSFRICNSHGPLPANSTGNQLTASRLSLKKLSKETKVVWWQPFSASMVARSLVIFLPVAVIIVLEVLYRKSVSSDGIATVSTTNTYLRYTWVYIPALLMFIVRVVTDSTTFTMKVFQPYSSLRVGGCPADDALLNDQLGKTSLHNLWYAIHWRQISIGAISVTMVLAPFLTIAVSGLYTLQMTNVVKDTMIQQLNVWTVSHDTDMDALTQNNNQSLLENLLPGLILTSNLSYPPWTYGPYSLPTITLQDPNGDVNGTSKDAKGSLLAATIPALRGSLNCTGVSQDSVSFLFNDRGVDVNISAASLPGCPSWPSAFWCSDHPSSGLAKPLEVGSFFDCYSHFMGSADRNEPFGVDLPPQIPGCPMMWFAYGRLSEIDKTEGLHSIENTTRVLFTELVTGSVEPVYPKPDNGKMAPFLTPSTDTPTNGLDGWFKAMIHGVDGIPATDLLGNENIGNLIGGLDRVFGIWMAQILNSFTHSTQPSNSTIPTDLPTYSATITSPSRARLVQSAVSTRIVQVLLGTMAFCAIIAFCNQDTRRVLPKNPCSIAAVASLLAGSELLKNDRFPPGAEFHGDRYLRDHVFGGWMFSMGWWDRKMGTPRFGIDVGQYDAKELEDLKQSSEVQAVHEHAKKDITQGEPLHCSQTTTRTAYQWESGRSQSISPPEG